MSELANERNKSSRLDVKQLKWHDKVNVFKAPSVIVGFKGIITASGISGL